MKEKYIYLGIGALGGLLASDIFRAIKTFHRIKKYKKLGMDLLKDLMKDPPKIEKTEEAKAEPKETSVELAEIKEEQE